MIESESRDNQLAVFLTEVHHPATRGFVLASMLDDSQTVGGITKLYRNAGADISRFGTFPVEKVNDDSLLELHEKWPTSIRI
jgi:hypothetical protein